MSKSLFCLLSNYQKKEKSRVDGNEQGGKVGDKKPKRRRRLCDCLIQDESGKGKPQPAVSAWLPSSGCHHSQSAGSPLMSGCKRVTREGGTWLCSGCTINGLSGVQRQQGQQGRRKSPWRELSRRGIHRRFSQSSCEDCWRSLVNDYLASYLEWLLGVGGSNTAAACFI